MTIREKLTTFVPEYDLGFFFPTEALFWKRNDYPYIRPVENTVAYKKTAGKHNFDVLGGVTFQNFDIDDVKARTHN